MSLVLTKSTTMPAYRALERRLADRCAPGEQPRRQREVARVAAPLGQREQVAAASWRSGTRPPSGLRQSRDAAVADAQREVRIGIHRSRPSRPTGRGRSATRLPRIFSLRIRTRVRWSRVDGLQIAREHDRPGRRRPRTPPGRRRRAACGPRATPAAIPSARRAPDRGASAPHPGRRRDPPAAATAGIRCAGASASALRQTRRSAGPPRGRARAGRHRAAPAGRLASSAPETAAPGRDRRLSRARARTRRAPTRSRRRSTAGSSCSAASRSALASTSLAYTAACASITSPILPLQIGPGLEKRHELAFAPLAFGDDAGGLERGQHVLLVLERVGEAEDPALQDHLHLRVGRRVRRAAAPAPPRDRGSDPECPCGGCRRPTGSRDTGWCCRGTRRRA